MLILTVRTDKPEAEIGLFEDGERRDYEVWYAHRELSNTLLSKITAMLERNAKTLHDIEGVVAFQGPGSFTGLRIGLTVVNSLAYGLGVPVVAAQDESWIAEGIARLQAGETDQMALPHYGSEAHITLPKK